MLKHKKFKNSKSDAIKAKISKFQHVNAHDSKKR